MKTNKEMREEFHEWCMKNPATNGIELALKLAQSSDWWLSLLAERDKELIEWVKGMRHPQAFLDERQDEMEFGLRLGHNEALEDIITKLEGNERN